MVDTLFSVLTVILVVIGYWIGLALIGIAFEVMFGGGWSTVKSTIKDFL